MNQLYHVITLKLSLFLRALPVLVLAWASPCHAEDAVQRASEDSYLRIKAAPKSHFSLLPHQFLSGLGHSMDRTHDALERGMMGGALRLDGALSGTSRQEAADTSYRLRWRNGVTLMPGGRLVATTQLNADLRLARLSERLRLLVSGSDDARPDRLDPEFPESGLDKVFSGGHVVRTELRYQLLHHDRHDLFYGLGVNVKLSPDLYSRLHYHYQLPQFYGVQASLGETAFVRTPNRLGATSEFAIRRALTEATSLRLAGSATWEQGRPNLEWGTELATETALDLRSSITWLAGAYGSNESTVNPSSYRVLTRYRRSFLRPWLFVELEPARYWDRLAERDSKGDYRFTTRLEVLFSGREAANPL